MWQHDIDDRLGLIKAHQEEYRMEAKARREVADAKEADEVTIAVSGRHIHLGSIVIVFGRMIREDGRHHAQGVRA
jgi:hypothetical protein